MLDWVVFGWTGDASQLLMKQHQAAVLTAAGSDIRETVSIFREGDSRCCPSGGTKARIWHWNGTRFTAGPWKKVTEPTEPSRFDSPSRNITCWMFDGRGNYSRGVGCQSDTPLHWVNMNAAGRLRSCSGIRCNNVCGCDKPDFPPLGYGKQITVGRFRCQSLRSGVRCTVIRSGKNFLISKSGVRRVGP